MFVGHMIIEHPPKAYAHPDAESTTLLMEMCLAASQTESIDDDPEEHDWV